MFNFSFDGLEALIFWVGKGKANGVKVSCLQPARPFAQMQCRNVSLLTKVLNQAKMVFQIQELVIIIVSGIYLSICVVFVSLLSLSRSPCVCLAFFFYFLFFVFVGPRVGGLDLFQNTCTALPSLHSPIL